MLAFPHNIINYSKKQTGKALARIILKNCGEQHLKKTLAEIQKKQGSITGFIYIHPLYQPKVTSIKDLFEKKENILNRFVLLIAKHLHTSVMQTSSIFRFLTVTRMDGELGLNEKRPFSIFGSGLAGLTKSLSREWSNTFCRFLDISPEISVKDSVSLILQELNDPQRNIMEIGYDARQQRCTLDVEPKIFSKQTNLKPDQKTIFAVSGGGRGITAECVVQIAAKFHSSFILFGRTSHPDNEPKWARSCTDPKALQDKVVSQLRVSHKRITPMMIEAITRPILAQREISKTLQRIKQSGGQAVYYSIDINNNKELKKTLQKAQQKLGFINGLIHGAGNIADKKIQNKTSKDFDSVFQCKVDGLKNILSCLDHQKLEFVLLFSSITSLWGNAGQTDYAAANTVLDKFAHSYHHLYPKSKVCVLNWGPWDAGMVTPMLKKIYQQKKIDLIPLDVGSQMCIEQFCYPRTTQLAICGNIAPTDISMDKEKLYPVEVQRTLLVGSNPFLQDHKIDNYSVLPATCAMHWMIQMCENVFPGYKFHQLHDFKVLKGIVFQHQCARNYTVKIEPSPTELLIKIYSQTAKKKICYHYSGKIILTNNLLETDIYIDFTLTSDGKPGEKYYSGVPLFHGKTFQGVHRVLNKSAKHITVQCSLPPITSTNQGQFAVSSFNPYIADVHLQSILLWSWEFLQMGCLPASIGSIEQKAEIPFAKEFYVSTKIKSKNNVRLLTDMIVHDKKGNVYMRWLDVELILSKQLGRQFMKTKEENGRK